MCHEQLKELCFGFGINLPHPHFPKTHVMLQISSGL